MNWNLKHSGGYILGEDLNLAGGPRTPVEAIKVVNDHLLILIGSLEVNKILIRPDQTPNFVLFL